MITIEQYLSVKLLVDTFEEQVKAAVLTLNGKNPKNFDLSKLGLSYEDAEFIVFGDGFVLRSADNFVMAYLEAKPHRAVVTHFPKTADDIQVGDIFHSSWGATMTLNTYWKVVKRTPCFITIRELATESENDGGFLSGNEWPLDRFSDHSNVYDKERFVDTDGQVYAQRTVKVQKNNSTTLKLEDFMYAHPWDGKPHYYNHCD